MGKKEVVPKRQYTDEFRQEVVRLAGSVGGNAAAKRLGVPQSTVKSADQVSATLGQGSGRTKIGGLRPCPC